MCPLCFPRSGPRHPFASRIFVANSTRSPEGQSNSPASKCSVHGTIDGGDDSRGAGSGPGHRCHIVERDATDRHHRHCDCGRNLLQSSQSNSGIRVDFGQGGEHRTESDVIRSPGCRGLGLVEVVGRDTDRKRVRYASNPQDLGEG